MASKLEQPDLTTSNACTLFSIQQSPATNKWYVKSAWAEDQVFPEHFHSQPNSSERTWGVLQKLCWDQLEVFRMYLNIFCSSCIVEINFCSSSAILCNFLNFIQLEQQLSLLSKSASISCNDLLLCPFFLFTCLFHELGLCVFSLFF